MDGQHSEDKLYAKVTDNKIDTDTKALDKKIAERFSVVI